MADFHEVVSELSDSDRRGAVWCAVLCARSVQHRRFRHEAQDALRLTGLWAQGVPVSKRRLQQAEWRLHPDFGTGPERSAVRYAARAASMGVPPLATRTVHMSMEASATALSLDPIYGDMANSAALLGSRAWWARMEVAQRDLTALIKSQTNPVAKFASGHPLADWVLEYCPRATREGTLGDALARAWRWRLRWWVPHERAAAERMTELPVWAAA